jgi:hypothetical protein
MKVAELFENYERSILSVFCKQLDKVSKSINYEGYRLDSLEGAPSSIGGNLYCSNNNFTSLHNIHKIIKHIGGHADFRYNPITSHVLGLLLIDGLLFVMLGNEKVEDIINKHLEGDRDVFACQEELIEAGYEEFAQL